LRINKNKIDQFIGFIVGLGAPVFSIAIALETFPVLQDIGDTANPAWRIIVMRSISFGVVINAALFFASMIWEREHVSRGILISCIPSLVGVIYFQFIV
jgi:hypothetical protein